MTLWEILKANKTGIAPAMFTMLAASKMNGGRDRLHELSGTPPLSFTSKGKPLTAWSITGNTVQNGTPTPDTPQEVKAVGDKTTNLLNFEDLIAAPSGLMPDGKFAFPHLLTLYLKPNTTYTCASSGTGSTTSLPADLNRSLYFCSTSEYNSVNVNNPVTYTTDSTGRVFIGFIDSRTNAQQYLNKTAYIWLNEGSTALPYEPYGYKIPVVTRGKNLWKTFSSKISSGVTITHDGEKYLFSGICNESMNVALNVELNAGTYFLQANANRIATENTYSCIDVWIPSLNKLYSIRNKVATYGTLTFSVDAPVESFLRIRLEKGINYDDFELKPMLELGTEATPYEPYHEPITTPIYLPTPLYSGEVIRSDGSRDVKFGKLVLTGEEAITTHKPFADGTVSIRIPSSKAKSNGVIYCTHLQNVSFSELYNNEKQGISVHLKDELNNLYCLISGFTNLTQYKDFFRNEYSAGTPITLWYQLAEPTTETVTVPQIPTINGTTVIDVDTAVKPESMTIKYRR